MNTKNTHMGKWAGIFLTGILLIAPITGTYAAACSSCTADHTKCVHQCDNYSDKSQRDGCKDSCMTNKMGCERQCQQGNFHIIS